MVGWTASMQSYSNPFTTMSITVVFEDSNSSPARNVDFVSPVLMPKSSPKLETKILMS